MYIIRFGSMRKTYKAAEWAMVGFLFACLGPLGLGPFIIHFPLSLGSQKK